MFIDPFWFMISLGVGLLYVYLTTRMPDVVIKYPTPENAGKIVYKDTNDVCYKYRAEKTTCPADITQVKQIPLQ